LDDDRDQIRAPSIGGARIRQEIAYREFCRQIADAGCVGYFVSLAGPRAVYYGRTGDERVEWFPGAKP
jgi:uncharacterized protein YbcV (DUF1398 family)